MTNSVPYHNVVVDADKWMASLGKERLDRYKKNLRRSLNLIHITAPGR